MRALPPPQYLPRVIYSVCTSEDPGPIITVVLPLFRDGQWAERDVKHPVSTLAEHLWSWEGGGLGGVQLISCSSAIIQWLPPSPPESRTVAEKDFKPPSRKTALTWESIMPWLVLVSAITLADQFWERLSV